MKLQKRPIFALDKPNEMDWCGKTDIAIVAEIGKRIKAVRNKKLFTQAEIAERSGISIFTVSQIETGKNTSLISLISVMRALKLLDNLEEFIPEPMISPVDLLKQSIKRKRKK